MINQYETVFIMTPVLSEEQMKETVNKFEKFMLENGCEIIHSENWGMKKLAYPIAKKTSGFYQLFEFKADGSFIKNLEIQYKRDEKILRFMTVTLDKYGIQYNEKRRQNRSEKTQSDNE